MIYCKCIDKKREGNNIIAYAIKDTNGNVKILTPEELKRAISTLQVVVGNLTLTSDNRLVDKELKTPDICKYILETPTICGIPGIHIVANTKTNKLLILTSEELYNSCRDCDILVNRDAMDICNWRAKYKLTNTPQEVENAKKNVNKTYGVETAEQCLLAGYIDESKYDFLNKNVTTYLHNKIKAGVSIDKIPMVNTVGSTFGMVLDITQLLKKAKFVDNDMFLGQWVNCVDYGLNIGSRSNGVSLGGRGQIFEIRYIYDHFQSRVRICGCDKVQKQGGNLKVLCSIAPTKYRLVEYVRGAFQKYSNTYAIGLIDTLIKELGISDMETCEDKLIIKYLTGNKEQPKTLAEYYSMTEEEIADHYNKTYSIMDINKLYTSLRSKANMLHVDVPYTVMLRRDKIYLTGFRGEGEIYCDIPDYIYGFGTEPYEELVFGSKITKAHIRFNRPIARMDYEIKLRLGNLEELILDNFVPGKLPIAPSYGESKLTKLTINIPKEYQGGINLKLPGFHNLKFENLHINGIENHVIEYAGNLFCNCNNIGEELDLTKWKFADNCWFDDWLYNTNTKRVIVDVSEQTYKRMHEDHRTRNRIEVINIRK